MNSIISSYSLFIIVDYYGDHDISMVGQTQVEHHTLLQLVLQTCYLDLTSFHPNQLNINERFNACTYCSRSIGMVRERLLSIKRNHTQHNVASIIHADHG